MKPFRNAAEACPCREHLRVYVVDTASSDDIKISVKMCVMCVIGEASSSEHIGRNAGFVN